MCAETRAKVTDLKITDEQLENILRVSMSPEVEKTELKFAKKFGIRIIIIYMLMAVAGFYLIIGAHIFADSSRYIKAENLFLEIGNLFGNSSFYVSFVTLWFSILLCALFTVIQVFNMKKYKKNRGIYVISYALVIFFQYYFVDSLIQPLVYINRLSIEVPNALKMSHLAIIYLDDGIKSSCSFSLMPAIILWGISFILLIVQMFRER